MEPDFRSGAPASSQKQMAARRTFPAGGSTLLCGRFDAKFTVPMRRAMFAALDDHLGPLISKLSRLADLDEEDRAALRALPLSIKPVLPNSYLVRDGDTASACSMLIDGYACRHKAASNGSRQILSFYMPGDVNPDYLFIERRPR
jgi:hypothetical protein